MDKLRNASTSPERKIMRIDFSTSQQEEETTTCNSNSSEILGQLEKLLQDLTKEVSSFRADQKAMQEKIKVLVEAISELGVSKQNDLGEKVAKKVPIQTIQELIAINKEIDDTNRGFYIDTIRSFILGGGIIKNLKNILRNPVVMVYDDDGVQRKAALKLFRTFYKVLLDAIYLANKAESADVQLRKPLQLQKKRSFFLNHGHGVKKNYNTKDK